MEFITSMKDRRRFMVMGHEKPDGANCWASHLHSCHWRLRFRLYRRYLQIFEFRNEELYDVATANQAGQTATLAQRRQIPQEFRRCFHAHTQAEMLLGKHN
eukprot:6171917-Pleurochrysis_carterae.AAC.1